jgi:hypothetical protein
LKRLLTPVVLTCSVLLCLKLANVKNPIRQLTNAYYIKGYQATSENYATDEIVIVNISDFPTEYIKDQIYILSKYNPSVIAVDYCVTDTTSIGSAIVFKNTILPIVTGPSDSIFYSRNPFTNHAEYGLTSIYSRSFFSPFTEIKKKTYPSFPTKILQIHDPRRYKKLLERKLEKEIINYSGNTSNFTYLGDLTNLKNLDVLKDIKGKIVLIGYTGVDDNVPTASDSHDSHPTPKGKMFGVILIANIVHTLLGNYINPASKLVMTLLVTFLAIINTYTMYLLFRVRFPYVTMKIIQLLELVGLFVISSFVIHQFGIALDNELMSFTVIISPEIAYWYLYLTRKNPFGI